MDILIFKPSNFFLVFIETPMSVSWGAFKFKMQYRHKSQSCCPTFFAIHLFHCLNIISRCCYYNTRYYLHVGCLMYQIKHIVFSCHKSCPCELTQTKRPVLYMLTYKKGIIRCLQYCLTSICRIELTVRVSRRKCSRRRHIEDIRFGRT